MNPDLSPANFYQDNIYYTTLIVNIIDRVKLVDSEMTTLITSLKWHDLNCISLQGKSDKNKKFYDFIIGENQCLISPQDENGKFGKMIRYHYFYNFVKSPNISLEKLYSYVKSLPNFYGNTQDYRSLHIDNIELYLDILEEIDSGRFNH